VAGNGGNGKSERGDFMTETKLTCPSIKGKLTALQCQVKQVKEWQYWGNDSKAATGCPCEQKDMWKQEQPKQEKGESEGMWKDENGERKNHVRIGLCPVCEADENKRIYKYKGEEMCGGCLTRKKRGTVKADVKQDLGQAKETGVKKLGEKIPPKQVEAVKVEEKQDVNADSESNALNIIPYHLPSAKIDEISDFASVPKHPMPDLEDDEVVGEITLEFSPADRHVYEALLERAKLNRRFPDQQILWELDHRTEV
jgi:hypothetical protein